MSLQRLFRPRQRVAFADFGYEVREFDLPSDGLIEYTSDCIRVTNRAELEARVCECYAVVKKEYDALFADARTRATIG